jgi:hypothetical protein
MEIIDILERCLDGEGSTEDFSKAKAFLTDMRTGMLVTENSKVYPVLESSTLDSQDGEISWELYTGEEYDCS